MLQQTRVGQMISKSLLLGLASKAHHPRLQLGSHTPLKILACRETNGDLRLNRDSFPILGQSFSSTRTLQWENMTIPPFPKWLDLEF